MDLSQDELRSSHTPWKTPSRIPHQIKPGSFRCDVLIVGAGITGALVAERLTREGRDVVIVDREHPTQGSTFASTAMLLWDIDRSLSQLVEAYGYERAVRAYQASHGAARGLIRLISQCGVTCDLRRRNALYLTVDENSDHLGAESALRSRAGLPTAFLAHSALKERFGILRSGAVLSPDAADADPAALAAGLLDVALRRGAQLRKGEAVVFDSRASKVTIGFEDGFEAEAKHVVLATGYVMPPIVQGRMQRVSSSWAIATAPQPANLWPERALIWEAAQNYHYARTTEDGRIIFGGEDDRKLVKPAERDAATAAKARTLAQDLKALWPRAETSIDYQWSGTFDTTDDGLPLIGPVNGAPRLCAAYGYGGNGITFSYLAAHLIAAYIAGGTSPLLDDFAIGRDPP
ncbi:MAG TPA: FAD-dependent oxidoreductase [Bradyrhizobium sp.]